MNIGKIVINSLIIISLCLVPAWADDHLELSQQKDSNAFLNWLKEADTSMEIGNFTSGGRAKDNDYGIFGRIKGDTAFYSNTYFEGFFKSADYAGFQLGLGVYAHIKTYDLHDTFEEKIDDDYHAFLSDIYLRYNLNELAFIQAGRFKARELNFHIDPENAEGAFFQYLDEDGLKFQLGVIRQFAFFFNDYVVDYFEVDNATSLSDPIAQSQVGDLIYFLEMKFNTCDNLSMNPYLYYQEDYITMYGLDSELTFQSSDSVTFGTRLYMYYISSEISSTDSDLEEDSFNFSFTPFLTVGNWGIEMGFAQFGDNSEVNRPDWGYRYLTNILYDNEGAIELVDFNGAYGTSETEVYFGRLSYQRSNWNLYFSGGYFDVGDNTNADTEVWELQVGGSYNPCEKFTIGSRIVSILREERVNNGIERDVNYFELWMAYKL